MMNKFEKQLEKWNHGTLRGAQAKLARTLKVSTATVALWSTGKRRPSKGYAHQMADLFQLDLYGVLRLFDASTTYPELIPPAAARALHDKENTDFTYLLPQTTQPAAARLPVLTDAPEHGLLALPPQTRWWHLPPQDARGAEYLVEDPENPSGGSLYFIRPSAVLEPGKLMLVRINGRTALRRIGSAANALTLAEENGTATPVKPGQKVIPLGVAVQKTTLP